MNIWWVSTSGNDTTGTGSKAFPFLTLERALTSFISGDQIRLEGGTYTPTDSIIISGKDGSIFAENPDEVYIRPQKTTAHPACVAITYTDRFYICGINIVQADDATGNLIGLYVDNVDTFLAYTCSVSDFSLPSGTGYGIYARGRVGRVEDCSVYNLSSAGGTLYGISVINVDPIDCEVTTLSGGGSVFGIFASRS